MITSAVFAGHAVYSSIRVDSSDCMRAFNFACSAPRIDLRAYGKFTFEHKSTLTRGGTFKLTFCCYRQAFIERSSFKEEVPSRKTEINRIDRLRYCRCALEPFDRARRW